MPNDAAAEKAGSAKHGDGATVRCHHDPNSPVYVGASHAVVEEPIPAIEQPINLADGSAQPSRPTTGRGEATLVGSDFEHGLEWRTAQSGKANAHTIHYMISRVPELGFPPMTICVLWQDCDPAQTWNRRENKLSVVATIHVRQAGLDFVRDEFWCHATKEYSLDRSLIAALSTLPIRGIILVS